MGNKISCATGNKEDKADAKAERKEKDNVPIEKKEQDVETNGDAKQVATVEISRPEEDEGKSKPEVEEKKEEEEKKEKEEEKHEEKKDDVTKASLDTTVEPVEVVETVTVMSTSVLTSSPPAVMSSPPAVTSPSVKVEPKKDDILEDIVQSVSIDTVKLSVSDYVDTAPGGVSAAKSAAAAKGAKVLAATVEKYDLPGDVATAKENFLLQFRNDHKIHAVDFMRIWRNFDADNSGLLEKKELKHFLKNLMEQKGEKIDKKKFQDYEKVMMQNFDTNNDKALDLSELAQLLPVEQNFLAKFPGREKCSRKEFYQIFDHFDKDNSGKVGHTELLALMKDMFEKEGPHKMKVPDMKAYADGVFEIYDTDKDGCLSRDELGMVMSKS